MSIQPTPQQLSPRSDQNSMEDLETPTSEFPRAGKPTTFDDGSVVVEDSSSHGKPDFLTWIDRRNLYYGEPCAAPANWHHHPLLREVTDRHGYRQSRIEDWLGNALRRHPDEKFGPYLYRASVFANTELKNRKKVCYGDEYKDPIDKFVMRLFYGTKLRMDRSDPVFLSVEDETLLLALLREECVKLNDAGDLRAERKVATTMSGDIHTSSSSDYGL